jgi:hypothetical protein
MPVFYAPVSGSGGFVVPADGIDITAMLLHVPGRGTIAGPHTAAENIHEVDFTPG